MGLTTTKSRTTNRKKQAIKTRKPRTVDRDKEHHWREVFLRFQSTGLPFRKFCALENISANTFQYWRRELRNRDEKLGISSAISTGDNRTSVLQEKIDFWLGIINAINSHNGSIRGFCRSHGISSGSLHFWEKRLKSMKLTDGMAKRMPEEQEQRIQFSQVKVLDDTAESNQDEKKREDNDSPLAEVLAPADTSDNPAAEFVEPRSGCRVRIFNGADQSTLSALIAALVTAGPTCDKPSSN